MNPLLSIVIPTKDRYYYLKYLIQYLKKVDAPEVEIVVQDNTYDNAEILTFIKSIHADSYIKYFHTKEPLTINENSDRAILNSTGEYICYIGDDDCVLSNILDVVRSLSYNKIDVGVFSRPHYIWPDIDIMRSTIYFSRYTFCSASGEYTYVNPKEELKNCLKHGGSGLVKMPKLYHGIVKRNVLNKIYEKYKTFFPGPSPDMANAVALSFLSESVIYIDYPVIIAGTGHSRIKNNEKHGDRQKLDNLTFLRMDMIENWNPQIPYIWTAPTIYAQTLYHTMSLFGANDMFETYFDWNVFYIGLGYNHYPFIHKCWTNKKANKLFIYVGIWARMVKKAIFKISPPKIRHLITRHPNLYFFKEETIPTIQDFAVALETVIMRWPCNIQFNKGN